MLLKRLEELKIKQTRNLWINNCRGGGGGWDNWKKKKYSEADDPVDSSKNATNNETLTKYNLNWNSCRPLIFLSLALELLKYS